MTNAILVAAALAALTLSQAETPLTSADLRLVIVAKPRVMVGEFLTVRTTWTARRPIALLIGSEWIEVDGGRGFRPHAEASRAEITVVSVPTPLAAGERRTTEHVVGLEPRSAPPELSGLEKLNASFGFVFDRPGPYRLKVRYEDVVSNVIAVEAVLPHGEDATLLAALRSQMAVLSSSGTADPTLREAGDALVRAYGARPHLMPFVRRRAGEDRR